jgi:hypothetical protein
MYCHRDGGASNMRQVCVPLTRAFPGPPYLACAAVGGPAVPSRALARTPTSSACSVSAPWVPRRRTIWDDHAEFWDPCGLAREFIPNQGKYQQSILDSPKMPWRLNF